MVSAMPIEIDMDGDDLSQVRLAKDDEPAQTLPHQADRRPYFVGEEIRRRHRALMNSEKFLPGHSLEPLWRWIQTGFAQHIRDRAATDLVSQIRQGALEAGVTP